MADKRTMEVKIVAKDQTKAGTTSAEGNLDKVASAAKGVAIAAAAAAVALGTATTAKALQLWAIEEQAILQVEKRLKSTGAQAWTTTGQIRAMADEFQRLTTFGNESVLQMQTLLFTFKDIRGNQMFERTTAAILDMSSALAQSTGAEPDLRSAATMVGKALQDPVLGLTAMSRAGIQFTDSQKDVIKSLVETNQKAEAQSIILDELESQFKGASLAVGFSGAVKQLTNAYGDLFEEIGEGATKSGELEGNLTSLTDYMSKGSTKKAMKEYGENLSDVFMVPVNALHAFALMRDGLLDFSEAIKLDNEGLAEFLKNFREMDPFVRAAKEAVRSLDKELDSLMETRKTALFQGTKDRFDLLIAETRGDLEQATQMLREIQASNLGGTTGVDLSASGIGGTATPNIIPLAKTLGGVGVGETRPPAREAVTELTVTPEAAGRNQEINDYIAGLKEQEEALTFSLLTREQQRQSSLETEKAQIDEFTANNIGTEESNNTLKLALDKEYHDQKYGHFLENVDRLAFTMLSEEEQIAVTYQNRLDMLNEANEMSLEGIEDYEEKKAAIEERWASDRLGVDQKEKKTKLTTASKYAAAAGQIASAAQTLAEGKSKAAFDVMKGAQIAAAVISTYSAATAAVAPPPLGLGPIAGIPLAIAAVISGLANVATISAQEYTGGGSGGTPSTPSASGTGAAPPASQTQTTEPSAIALGTTQQPTVSQPEPQPSFLTISQPSGGATPQAVTQPLPQQGEAGLTQIINIRIDGNVYDEDEQARNMVGPIKKALADGVTA